MLWETLADPDLSALEQSRPQVFPVALEELEKCVEEMALTDPLARQIVQENVMALVYGNRGILKEHATAAKRLMTAVGVETHMPNVAA